MKRLLWLAAVPIGLALFSMVGNARTDPTAQVTLTTDQVTALRSSTIARLAPLGAERTGERTVFDGQGTAELDFTVPTARLEDALTMVGQLGATVTDQEVQVRTSPDKPVTDRLDQLQGCLADAADEAAKRSSAAVADLNGCRDRLRQVTADSATTLPATSTLRVVIKPDDTSSPWVAVTITGLVIVALAMIVVLIRAGRAARDIDLRLDEQLSRTDELYLRRN